ncbi:MAG TPA: nuclear transport factor 2 family protein [Streptosporangiaceae bacterium]|jgi:3-phenylpropionate/cinnamic acid dioxygenase small subunit
MTGNTSAAPEPSRSIENLIATYAFLVDDGEFAGLGQLLAEADFSLNGGPAAHGRDAIERLAHETLQTYDDGTPRTRHVTTNIIIEVDDQVGTATSRSYFTVFQSLPGFPLQAIASGRYHDRFQRHDGGWRFAERRVTTSFTGDVSHHVRLRK